MDVITNTSELETACARFSVQPYITIDTEFLRENTFWPKLCLIQIGSPEEELIIDPLAKKLKLDAFFGLMANKKVTKVFHAARQDLEIIYHLAQVIPEPLFDTQIAAMVCGFGESVSYGQLVKKVTKTDLDKTSRYTDWSRRPLSQKQLRYALADVTHLRDIYAHLCNQLDTSQRSDWLHEEMSILNDPETYIQRPELAWKRLKMRVKTKRALAIMMEVAAWREREAQQQNVPRGRIIKDDVIYDLANQEPQTPEELSHLRSVNDGFARSARGKGVLEAIITGLNKPEKDVPALKKTKPLPADAIAVIDLLRVLLKTIAAQHDVASKLIATTDDLEKIAINDTADVPALKGWRYELFGKYALELKNGRLSLAIQDGRIITQDNVQHLNAISA
ncbi:MAG: ribonuclease D [Pseudomonadota bacterium]